LDVRALRCPRRPRPFVLRVRVGDQAPAQNLRGVTMPTYMALTFTPDVDWSQPGHEDEMKDYREFAEGAAAVIRGGHALYPTATATTVRVHGGKGGDVVTSDG